jgi:virginiamycin B lyase
MGACVPMKRLGLLVFLALSSMLPASSKDQPVAALTGMVTSDGEGHMGGVLVTARAEGANMTVTVISDDQGRYAFPREKLQPGKYALTIRAAGYELAGQAAAEIKSDKPPHVDIKLVKTKNLASQLTGAEWMMSMPGNEKQKKALFHCDQCHSLDLVAKSTYDADGWLLTLHRMQNQWQAGSTFTHPMPPPFPTKEYPSDPELAKYLSSINLSGDRTAWPYELKTFPRPRGADTKVVITEYEIPRAGSSPHDLAIDQHEMVWYSDFQAPNIGRLDPHTGQFKEWRLPRLKPGLPENNLTIELDPQGNPWLPRGYQGCAATMFDVKTEKFHTWSAPAEYNDDHASCTQGNVGPNGMVWFNSFNTSKMFELDPKTGDVKVFNAFPAGSAQFKGPNRVFYFGIDENFATAEKTHKMYGSAIAANGDAIYCDIEGSTIAVLEHATGQVTLYPTPTRAAAPRRGSIDSAGNFWFGEWMASQLGMFDPQTKQIEEWRPPIPWSGNYRAIRGKNGDVWSGGMSTDYVHRLNPKTGEWREYMLPTLGGEMRDIKIDDSGATPKVWVPLVHAGILAKIEPLE